MPENNFDGFLRVDGVTSECKDPAHLNWIDVDSISFGASVADFAIGEEGVLEADDPSVSPITFTCGMHKGSPALFKFCVTGEHIPTAEFHARSGGGDPFTFLKILLEDCLITGVQNSSGNEPLPTETITLAYRKITYQYIEQDTKTGQAATGGTAEIEYDQAAHAEEDEE